MLEIDLHESAQAYVASIPRKHQRQVLQRIDTLASNPFIVRSKQLEGFAPWRRYRAGSYRIIYFVDGNFLRVVLIDKRNDDAIYRRLRQLFR